MAMLILLGVCLLPWTYAQTLGSGDSRNVPASNFLCDATLSVSFNSLNVRCGTEVAYQAIDNTGGPEKMPSIKWAGPGENSDLFTIIIVDRDAPNATIPNLSPIRHMAIANVPYGLLKAGFDSTSSVPTALFAYAKPGPPTSSGCHRYYVILYRQTPGVTPSLSVPSSADSTYRRVWDFPSWVKSNSLVGPISINYWQTQNINTASLLCPAPMPPIVGPSVYPNGLINRPPVYGAGSQPPRDAPPFFFTDLPPADDPGTAPWSDAPPLDWPPSRYDPPEAEYNFPPFEIPSVYPSPPAPVFRSSISTTYQGMDYYDTANNATKRSSFKSKVEGDVDKNCALLGYDCKSELVYIAPGSIVAAVQATLPAGTSASSATQTTLVLASLLNSYYSKTSNLPAGATSASTVALSSNGIPAPPPSPESTNSNSSNLGLALGLGLGLGIGILAIIGIVVFFVLHKRKNSDARVADKVSAKKEEPSMFPQVDDRTKSFA